jgi:SAM-dependent methyltransferase
MKCRHCDKELRFSFLDLDYAPPSNAYLTASDLSLPEKYFPLRVKVCDSCWLVQTEDYAQADDLFNSDYAYFSSTSTSWLHHAYEYSEMIIKKLSLNNDTYVIEVASNDGYLLKNFVKEGIPCLGIEPTASTANAAEKLGIKVVREFFGENLAKQLLTDNNKADLIIGNNVYAHVPDINDFTKGLKTILKENGTINLEFPHLQNLIEKHQFDTIYHEHFSYLSLNTVFKIFNKVGLKIYDVEKISTHGGSLRIYGCHEEDDKKIGKAVFDILEEEKKCGLDSISTYLDFQKVAEKIKYELLSFLISAKQDGKKVIAYGAAAKGNTLLNYAGVKSDLISCVFDAADSKQNKFMPGSHIPIISPTEINNNKFDYILILPWNISEEIKKQLLESGVRSTFVTAIPKLVYS